MHAKDHIRMFGFIFDVARDYELPRRRKCFSKALEIQDMNYAFVLTAGFEHAAFHGFQSLASFVKILLLLPFFSPGSLLNL